MGSRTAIIFLAILRIGAGFALALMAVPMLIQGGLSRYARFSAHADWRYLSLALVMLAAGSFLIRPFWWRYLANHHRR